MSDQPMPSGLTLEEETVVLLLAANRQLVAWMRLPQTGPREPSWQRVRSARFRTASDKPNRRAVDVIVLNDAGRFDVLVEPAR